MSFSFFSIVYALIRYVLAGTTPVEDIPLFITNKAVSFSVILVLFVNTLLNRIKKTTLNKKNTVHSVLSFLIILHVLFSLGLLSTDYYPKFFSENKLNVSGGLSILFGAIGTAIIFAKIKTKLTILLSIIALHLFFMGYKGWLTIEKWNGYMPPITLLCFILILLIIVFEKKSKITFS